MPLALGKWATWRWHGAGVSPRWGHRWRTVMEIYALVLLAMLDWRLWCMLGLALVSFGMIHSLFMMGVHAPHS